MNREKAIDVLDRAFGDQVSKLFSVLAAGEVAGEIEQSVARFEKGFEIALDAYGRASAVVEKKFPD